MTNSAALQERPRPYSCKDCYFFGILDHVTPICRVEPPKILPVMPRPDGNGWISTVAWPDVSPETDWCGKFVHHTVGTVHGPVEERAPILHHQV